MSFLGNVGKAIVNGATSAVGGLPTMILNAGTSLLNNALAKQTAAEQNAANMELAKYQYQTQVDMWNKQNAYNSPLEQMKRYEEAGLNPNLIYGSSSSAGNATSMPQFVAPSYQAATQKIDMDFNQALNAAIAITKMDLEHKDNESLIALRAMQGDAEKARANDLNELARAQKVLNDISDIPSVYNARINEYLQKQQKDRLDREIKEQEKIRLENYNNAYGAAYYKDSAQGDLDVLKSQLALLDYEKAEQERLQKWNAWYYGEDGPGRNMELYRSGILNNQLSQSLTDAEIRLIDKEIRSKDNSTYYVDKGVGYVTDVAGSVIGVMNTINGAKSLAQKSAMGELMKEQNEWNRNFQERRANSSWTDFSRSFDGSWNPTRKRSYNW